MSTTSDQKKTTQLLLRGCSCRNCKFTIGNAERDWCKHADVKPKDEVCIHWEKNPMSDLLESFQKIGPPSTIAADLVKVYPMAQAVNQIFKLVTIKKQEDGE